MRSCPVCQTQMAPRFASECEPPIAWACLECGVLQLETGGRAFSAEEAAAVRAWGPLASPPEASRHVSRAVPPPAAVAAREILESFESEFPIDVEAVAERLGFPVRWRVLPPEYRGGVEGEADARVLVLNREYPFHSEAERRWTVAEELGHAILEHGTLVASEEPGRAVGIRETGRQDKETEAKVFAAELLMPAAAVRGMFRREQSLILRALGSEERSNAIRTVIAALAREFRVSQHAMRIRLADLGLVS